MIRSHLPSDARGGHRWESAGGHVVIEGVALERQQHEVMTTGVLGGRDVKGSLLIATV
jgi:hypothetical protein